VVQVRSGGKHRYIRTDSLEPRTLPVKAQEPSMNKYVGEITIATLLKVSEIFTPEWVDKLYRGVARNLKRPFRFVCLTDYTGEFEEDIEVIPLLHKWDTKQAKLEIFRPDLDLGRVLYMDLDTIIVGSLEDIASYDGKFAALSDFSSPLNRHCGTGFMLWEAGYGHGIYEAFKQTTKEERVGVYRVGGGRGDQLFIYHHTPYSPHYVQRVWPGQFVSYRDVRFRCNMNDEVRVVIFHGKDKPNGESTLPCVKPHWR